MGSEEDLSGVFVFEKSGVLAGLEVYGLTGDAPDTLWSEINLDKAEWRISPERMKMRRGHIVPLSKQALAILKELKLLTGRWQYVFPQEHKPLKPMSENAIS